MATDGSNTDLTLEGGGSLNGSVTVPGDKSISHRALILGALATGETRIHNLSQGADVLHTASAMEQLGAKLTYGPQGVLQMSGGNLKSPSEPVYVGNAGTGIRLMCGLVSGQGLYTVFYGDSSLNARPMDRVISLLSALGAQLAAREGKFAPVVNIPAALHGESIKVEVPSAQVKSAILLAALGASSPTTLTESTVTRKHSEHLLTQFGAKISVDDHQIRIEPSELEGTEVRVPGDPSHAAFWAVGAAIAPGSTVHVPDVELSAERVGFLHVLERMGASIQIQGHDLEVTYEQPLKPTDISASEVASLVDEVPILAVAAAAADGESTFYGLGELTVKESNRLLGVRDLVNCLGAHAQVEGDTLTISGVETFKNASIDSHGDHRMSMSAAIATLLCTQPTSLTGVEYVATSYPEFFTQLEALRK